MSTLRQARRVSLAIAAAVTLCLLAYGVGWALQADASDQTRTTSRADTDWRPSGAASTDGPATDPSADGTSAPTTGPSHGPSRDATTASPDEPSSSSTDSTADDESDVPAEPDEPTAPALEPGPTLIERGARGDDVRDLQARLAQIDWFDERVTGYFGDVTQAAVRGFQAKRGIPVTGEVDQRTLDRLAAMTREPTAAELSGQPSTNEPGALDSRCLTGRVLCIDKSSRTLRWVVGGKVLRTVDVRFGAEYTPTREGVFSVYRKSRDHVSSIYHTAMPYAMFFSGGQAVHYSSDFAAVGYNGASHGCVNVRDEAGVAWLFDHVRLGDKVVVYWS